MAIPLGVVAVLTSSYAPWVAPFMATVLALITGNAVLLKPSVKTALCGLKVAEIYETDLNDLKAASEIYQKMLELEPDNTRTLRAAARLAARLGDSFHPGGVGYRLKV